MSIVLVGEAWGESEERLQHPFVGAAGVTLLELLDQAGLLTLSRGDRDNIKAYWKSGYDGATRNPYFNWLVWQEHRDLYLTNVFNVRPKPTNDIKNLCGPKAEGLPGWPSLQQGKYVNAKYASELSRLFDEITQRAPNVIIALGATAAWALLKSSGIKSIRGAATVSHTGHKVLPTYHPSAVMRDWELRPIALADLMKAKREAAFPELRRPEREIWIEPSIEDLDNFHRRYIFNSNVLSVDIETSGDTITCIGFAPSEKIALVVPFFDHANPTHNYWPSQEQEEAAWRRVRHWLSSHPHVLFQNGMYDMHFLWRTMGIAVPGARSDTMLLHHALQPEMEKGLAFLGSIYTDEASWKMMKRGKRKETIKRED